MRRKTIEALIMLAISAFLLWIPYHLRQPAAAARKIIVATPALNDATFARSVVMILSHDGYGATGVILNKDAGSTRTGGPLDPDDTITLHTSKHMTRSSTDMTGTGLAWTRGARTDVGDHIVFSGHAGWKRGQLENEIAQGYWRMTEASPALVLNTAPDKLWDELTRRISAESR